MKIIGDVAAGQSLKDAAKSRVSDIINEGKSFFIRLETRSLVMEIDENGSVCPEGQNRGRQLKGESSTYSRRDL